MAGATWCLTMEDALRSYTENSKIEFPRFNGFRVHEWLPKCEQFFYLYNTPPESKVKLAAIHFEGLALQWHLNYMRLKYDIYPYWNEYVVAVVQRFGNANDEPHYFSAQKNQTRSVHDYRVEFGMASNQTFGRFSQLHFQKPSDIVQNQHSTLDLQIDFQKQSDAPDEDLSEAAVNTADEDFSDHHQFPYDNLVVDPASEIVNEQKSIDLTPFFFDPPLTGEDGTEKSQVEDNHVADPMSEGNKFAAVADSVSEIVDEQKFPPPNSISICSEISLPCFEVANSVRFSAFPSRLSPTIKSCSNSVPYRERDGYSRNRLLRPPSNRKEHFPPPKPPDRGTVPKPSLHSSLSVTTMKGFAATPYSGNYSYILLLIAIQVFDQMPKHHLEAWKAIITGCTDNEHEDVDFELFTAMIQMENRPGNYIFSSLLSLCSLEFLHYRNLLVASDYLQIAGMTQSILDKNGSVDFLNISRITLQQVPKLAPVLCHVHNWSYLNDFFHDDYNSVMENFLCYLDPNTAGNWFDLVSTAGGNEIALLCLGMMHFNLGYPTLALEALTNAVSVFKQHLFAFLKGSLKRAGNSFEPPLGLPLRKAGFDHRISLMEGSFPFKLTSYSYFPIRKYLIGNEVENLLQPWPINDIISPYALPTVLVRRNDVSKGILHRKMIKRGHVMVPNIMLKWRTLPPKHGTWEFVTDVEVLVVVHAIALVQQLFYHQFYPETGFGPLFPLLFVALPDLCHAIGALVSVLEHQEIVKSCLKSNSIERGIFTSSIITAAVKDSVPKQKQVVDEFCPLQAGHVWKTQESGWVYAISKLLTEDAAFKFVVIVAFVIVYVIILVQQPLRHQVAPENDLGALSEGIKFFKGASFITSIAYPPNFGITKVFHVPMMQLCTTTAYASAQRFQLAHERKKYVAVLHRKMVPRGSVQAAKILLKWKALLPKHGTWRYSSLRTRMS